MCFERTPAVILVFLSLLSAIVDGMMYVVPPGVILLFLCTNCMSTYKLYVYTTYIQIHGAGQPVCDVCCLPPSPLLPPGVILFDQLTQEVAWRQPSISC